MTTSTHTGTCQACGSRQAVHVVTGNIAKHGYTTEYGFFNGTCGGSDHLPLELDTAVNIATVAALRAFADTQDARADGDILTVSVEISRKYVNGKSVVERKDMDRAEFVATQPRYASFDREVDTVRLRLRRIAASVRADAIVIDALRATVHGQPLLERVVQSPIQRESYKTHREAYARVEALKAAGHKAQSRRDYRGYAVTFR